MFVETDKGRQIDASTGAAQHFGVVADRAVWKDEADERLGVRLGIGDGECRELDGLAYDMFDPVDESL